MQRTPTVNSNNNAVSEKHRNVGIGVATPQQQQQQQRRRNRCHFLTSDSNNNAVNNGSNNTTETNHSPIPLEGDDNEQRTDTDWKRSNSNDGRRRRLLLQQGLAVGSVATAIDPLTARASKAEIDKATGELFTPKSDMLSGGSDAARGIPLGSSSAGAGGRRDSRRLEPGEALQSVYETRFVTYLSRFLLNFDPAAYAWSVQQGLSDSWDESQRLSSTTVDQDTDASYAEERFAEFAESVEFGLANYFVGPYGSYSSVSAARAGILAAEPAPSVQPDDVRRRNLFDKVIFGQRKLYSTSDQQQSVPMMESVELAKQGILNLYTLLKTRYQSIAAKRQLAVLFSLISSPLLQPVDEIRALLGEIDNATITAVKLIKPSLVGKEQDPRTSSRRGGGYSLQDFPKVLIDPPPALGDEYKASVIKPILNPTTRILRIRVLDGGAGTFS